MPTHRAPGPQGPLTKSARYYRRFRCLPNQEYIGSRSGANETLARSIQAVRNRTPTVMDGKTGPQCCFMQSKPKQEFYPKPSIAIEE
jgi:hypothetical protein